MAVNAENIIEMAIAFLLAVVLLPMAMAQIITTSTTGWNSAVVTIFQLLLPIIAVIGIGLYFIPQIRNGDQQ